MPYPINKKEYKPIYKKYNNKCVDCGSNDNLHIHHIDKNHENNSEDNLMLLCKNCHWKKHSFAKAKILELLKDKEIRATTRIAGLICTDHTHALKLLIELEQEGLVKKMPSPDGKMLYWGIK